MTRIMAATNTVKATKGRSPDMALIRICHGGFEGRPLNRLQHLTHDHSHSIQESSNV